MKILIINEVCGHTSTGRISAELAEKLEKERNEVKIAFGRDGYVPERYQRFAHRIGSDKDVKMHALLTRLTDKHGLGSKRATKEFLKWAEEYDPDMVWLHNLHGYYINYESLFEWIKKRPEMKVKWTLHDCWVYTGHCVFYSYQGCERWKTRCHNCPQKKKYPSSILIDNSKSNYERKKATFQGVKDLEIITPSNWLADQVKQSFLKDYPITVVHNEIDKTKFKPTPSDLRERFGIQNKKIILGVANVWEERKGLNDFIELSKMLDEKYVIVLVGLSDKQIKALPDGIIGIQKTNDVTELAGIYTTADYFVNPSREETFGMTALEAAACGTKSIVYKGTACEEIAEEYGGIAVEQGAEYIYRELIG